jgi:hypothetical protein
VSGAGCVRTWALPRAVYVFDVGWKCVCARGWLLLSACFSGFRCVYICVSVGEGCARTCSACLEGVRLPGVCSGALGAVCVPTRFGVYRSRCSLAELCTRSASVVWQWSLRASMYVGVCLCGPPGPLWGCFWGVSLWFPCSSRRIACRGYRDCPPTALSIATSSKALLREVN